MKRDFDAARALAAVHPRAESGIGSLSEGSLHHLLKFYFEPDADRHEVGVGRYFADILNEDGIIEIQTRALYRLSPKLDAFLPHVDNWATCDIMSPKVFKKHRPELLTYIRDWIASDKTYTVRFGIGMLMTHFLDEDFETEYPEMVAAIRSEEYYVNMMIAWYFATALAKQYDSILPYLENRRLEPWTHNKTIQKAVESYRITAEQKAYLKKLKR